MKPMRSLVVSIFLYAFESWPWLQSLRKKGGPLGWYAAGPMEHFVRGPC